MSYPGHSLGGVLPLCREAVDVFYNPNRLGKSKRRDVLSRSLQQSWFRCKKHVFMHATSVKQVLSFKILSLYFFFFWLCGAVSGICAASTWTSETSTTYDRYCYVAKYAHSRDVAWQRWHTITFIYKCHNHACTFIKIRFFFKFKLLRNSGTIFDRFFITFKIIKINRTK